MKKIAVFIFTVIFLCPALAPAELIDRGGGLIYDTDRNTTWLQDANYAQTSGYDSDGVIMLWTDALAWADQLEYGGLSDWRLPTAYNIDGSGPCYGYCPDSEMGHLYFVEGITSTNFGPFINIQLTSPQSYWLAEADGTDGAYDFSFAQAGLQATRYNFSGSYVWAVRDGDVGYAPNSIDIIPDDESNTINLKRTKSVNIAILSSSDFYAPTQVQNNKTSLTFGAIGNEQSLMRCAKKAKDVNNDGLNDLVCTFSTKTAGFVCGDTEGVLKGRTATGRSFEGSQAIVITPCN